MSNRKTIPVARIRELVNFRLTIEPYLAMPGKDREMNAGEAYRMALASLLESVLHETGNYRGFGYQEGQVTRHADGPGDSPDITDETRRVYYGRSS